jgi:hypothetical protein
MKRLVLMLTRHRMAVVATLAMSAVAWGPVVLAQDDDPFAPNTKAEKGLDTEKPPPPPVPDEAPATDAPVKDEVPKRAADAREDDARSRAAEATEVDVPTADKENADAPEVLARGPIHEAFAESVVFDPKPGLIIHKKPPADVPELPPEQRPDETDTVWIPGYWAWDDDRDDFLWISGIWRRIPQGRQWVAGYWAELPDDTSGEGVRYQWVAGRWAALDEEEVEYLPPPPPTLEEGPNVPAPSPDYVWQPGCWMWDNSQYNWRGGFWAAGNPNWMWVPPYYSWTPRGYLYNTGYWDYGLNRRGICYAPVYFNSPFYTRSGYYYSPLVAFNMGLFNQHLFLRPGYNHYYFGDYYASRYQQGGIYPWFAYHNRRYGYDPFYVNARAQFGASNPKWNQQLIADFQNRRDHVGERPPHTFAQMKQLEASGKIAKDRDGNPHMLLGSVDALAKSMPGSPKLTALDNKQRRDLLQNSEQWSKLRSDRRAAETAADVRDRAAARQRAADVAGKGKTADPAALRPDRAKMPKSPFASTVPGQQTRKGDGRVQVNKPAVPGGKGRGQGVEPSPENRRTDVDRSNLDRPNQDRPGRLDTGKPDTPNLEKGLQGPAGKGPSRPESKTPEAKGPNAAPRFQGPQGSGGPGGREPKTTPPKGGDSQPRFQGPQGGGGPGGREPNSPSAKGADASQRFQGPQGGAPKGAGTGGGAAGGAGGGSGAPGGQRPPAPRLNLPTGPSGGSAVPRVAPSGPSVAPRVPNVPSVPRANAGPQGGGGGGGAPRAVGGGGGGGPRGGGGGDGPRGGGDGGRGRGR